MGILFKTYNKKHQLHLYNEVWVFKSKQHLNDLLNLFPKQEAAKIKATPVGKNIEVELNGLIMDCRDTADLKMKFAHLVDLKEKFQKLVPVKKK
ncbi:MAG: hypothetical protein KKH52_03385 [Nanoarchaeota archaeon]|nr:hypothetical protein [Nanoarchaeota archaeon]MBU1621970.1 hypothetical protein [Nanoarchaeota archaeon]MBU1974411.1 hypothetical protein [Nanoarchaeota archaeon]